MNLLSLLRDVECEQIDKSLFEKDIKDIKIDHRQVEKGDVYLAMRGSQFNGNDFASIALEKGAACVVSDELESGEKVVNVRDVRSAYALMSKNFFGRVCDNLRIIAITGTNGKTTVCNTIADMLRGAGYKVGVIGTLGAKVDGEFEDTGFTTPDPYKLHSIFANMNGKGVDFVVMEASAHALALNKLDGIRFEMGVLTNITEDHLDFFENMDDYADAKLKLFEKGRTTLGIYCADKAYTDRLLKKSGVNLLSYGFTSDCDYAGRIFEKNFSGSHFACTDYKGNIFDVKTKLVGGFNVENALAAIAVCKNLGLSNWNILEGLNAIKAVEGRFNTISTGKANIVIDFAHTPDGLEKVLQTAREISDGKVVAIFGCGGNRDKQKRPIMGRIASQQADEIILTSDNPRFEDPNAIISQIKKGVKGPCKVLPNRKKAIEYALENYQNGQTIVIAGKGAEKYQEINGVKYPYSDFDVVREVLKGQKKIINREDYFLDKD